MVLAGEARSSRNAVGVQVMACRGWTRKDTVAGAIFACQALPNDGEGTRKRGGVMLANPAWFFASFTAEFDGRRERDGASRKFPAGNVQTAITWVVHLCRRVREKGDIECGESLSDLVWFFGKSGFMSTRCSTECPSQNKIELCSIFAFGWL